MATTGRATERWLSIRPRLPQRGGHPLLTQATVGWHCVGQLKRISPASDQSSMSSLERLPVKAGPVPDKLTIRPVDDGRYGLHATFQGASGHGRAERHQQELQRL